MTEVLTKKLLTDENWVWGLLPQDPGDLRNALKLLLELEKNYSDIIDVLEVRTWIAMAYFNLSEAELSREYHEKARKELLCASDSRKEAVDILLIDMQLASIYLHFGENDLAMQRCEEGHEFFDLYRDEEGGISRTLFCYFHGLVLEELGEFQSAIPIYEVGLKQASKIKDDSQKLRWISLLNYSIGNAHGMCSHLKRGLRFLLKVKSEDLLKVESERFIVSLLTFYYELDRFHELLKAYEKYSGQLVETPHKGRLFHLLGVAYYQTDSLDKARKFLNMSVDENPTEQFVIAGNKRFLEALEENENQ